jgi:hypothetical protein
MDRMKLYFDKKRTTLTEEDMQILLDFLFRISPTGTAEDYRERSDEIAYFMYKWLLNLNPDIEEVK